MKELPNPEPGGKVRDILQFLNLPNKDDQLLVQVWLIAAMIPHIPRPILVLHGGQGAAKTTTAKVLRALLDPSSAPVVSPSNSKRDWMLAFEHHAVPIFDNEGKMENWKADMFCKASTGDGMIARALYTDNDEFVTQYKRAIILSGINIPSAQPDLLDRCLLVELARINMEDRKTEERLWKRFNKEKGKIFGAMIRVLERTLRIYLTLTERHLPRMADFALYGCAIAKALGYSEETFVHVFSSNAVRQNRTVLDADPVAQLILQLMEKNDTWSGTITELAKALRDMCRDAPPACLYANASQALGRRLRVLQSTMADYGVTIQFKYRGKGADSRLHIYIEKL